MDMAIQRPSRDELLKDMMRVKEKEYHDAWNDAIVYGTGVMKHHVEAPPEYSMAEVQLTDGTTQTFMIKANPRIVQHLLDEMNKKHYLTMWNDTDVLCIRADQVKQFTLRAFTQGETK
jgi:hypothetical protein